MKISDFVCDLCGSHKSDIKRKLSLSIGVDTKKYDVVSCQICALHSLYPLPSESEFKVIYENYAKRGNRIDVEKNRIETIYPSKLKIIKKYKPTGNIKVLDIGAGIGGFINVAKKEGYSVTGIEFENEQVALAKEHFDLEIQNIKFEDFAKTNEVKYDVIHMHHVLEHVQSPKNVLSLVKSQLKDDGIIIIEVPNQFFVFPHSILFNVGMIEYSKPYHPYHHLYFFSPKTIKMIMKNARFNILELNVIHKPRKKSIRSYMKYIIALIFNLATSSVIEVIAQKEN